MKIMRTSGQQLRLVMGEMIVAGSERSDQELQEVRKHSKLRSAWAKKAKDLLKTAKHM